MASVHKELSGFCYKCNEERSFHFELAYVDYNGIVPCFVCGRCNTFIPSFAWDRYQADGKMFIPV